jgi:hypothetical protein
MENKNNKYTVAVANEQVRKLTIDFDQYTDGDPVFKSELTVLMLDNIKELQLSLGEAMKVNDSEIFRKTCHKVKPTLSMIDDAEFNDIIEVLKCQINNQNCISVFTKISHGILRALEEEIS